MKMIAVVLSLIASAFLLTSCASQGATSSDQPAVAADNSSAVSGHAKHHHHDYKGEMSK